MFEYFKMNYLQYIHTLNIYSFLFEIYNIDDNIDYNVFKIIFAQNIFH